MVRSLYTLQIDSISARFEIKVNDIPLYKERVGKPTSAEIPINHFLVDGRNNINVNISPSKHDVVYVNHTKTDFEVYTRDIREVRETRAPVCKLVFPDYKNDETLNSSTIESDADFHVSIPYTPNWLKGLDLKITNEMLQQAISIYRNYYNALYQKNADKILEMTSLKIKDYADSYYSTINEQNIRITESLTEVFKESSFKLLDFDIQEKRPEIHGYGKLLTLKNEDNRSPLQYYNVDQHFTKTFPIYLGMIDNNFQIVL